MEFDFSKATSDGFKHIYVFDYCNHKILHTLVYEEALCGMSIPNFIEGRLGHRGFEYFISSRPIDIQEFPSKNGTPKQL